MSKITKLAIGRIADWCKIMLADEHGTLKTISVGHGDPAIAELATDTATRFRLHPSLGTGSPHVFATGKSIFNRDIQREDLEALALDPEHRSQIHKIGFKSIMIVPIRARDRILGTIGLAFAGSGRHYGSGDLAFAEELGRRAGMAIENARLYLDAQAQRERLQKAVQSRDEFISIASHELKTPVTALILHAEMAALQLQRREPTDELRERLQKYVDISTSQIDRLSRLIEEMLDVSRIANGRLSMEMETLDLTQLVSGVFNDFRDQIRETGSAAELQFDGAIQ